jgi:hypothetical protein
MAPAIWVNPIVKTKLGDAAEANLRTELQQCAATKSELPKSCKTGNKTITFAKAQPTANCHWQCGETCPKKENCAWEVKTGVWNLEYRRLAAIEREQRKVCGEDWANVFDDPAQYEETSCEAECFQLSAVASLSKFDAACAMEIFGVLARRPRCRGPVPQPCRNKDYSHSQDALPTSREPQ